MTIEVKEGDRLTCPSCPKENDPGDTFNVSKHPSGDLMFTCIMCHEVMIYSPPITGEMVLRFVRDNYPAAAGFVGSILKKE